MCRPSPEAYVSVSELPSLLIELFERAAYPLLPGAQGPVKLLVRYLRRKPGRGLVVIYSVDEAIPRPRHTRREPSAGSV